MINADQLALWVCLSMSFITLKDRHQVSKNKKKKGKGKNTFSAKAPGGHQVDGGPPAANIPIHALKSNKAQIYDK